MSDRNDSLHKLDAVVDRVKKRDPEQTEFQQVLHQI